MTGGGLGLFGVYFSPNEVIVLGFFFLIIFIFGIAWTINVLGHAIERRPRVEVHNPSDYFWKRFDDMQNRLMWHLKGGSWDDDRAMLNWTLQEIYFMKKIKTQGDDHANE